MKTEYNFKGKWIPCIIVNWDDKSERFAILYKLSEDSNSKGVWALYEDVRGWSWKELALEFSNKCIT